MVATCYLLGVSTRRMEKLVETLGITRLSKWARNVYGPASSGRVRKSSTWASSSLAHHADLGRYAGTLPSFGTVGDGLDNAMMESVWSSMQIELLNRKKWKTRVELANAIFDYIEIFHNRQRRHSALGYRTPIDYELRSQKDPSPLSVSHRRWSPNGRSGQTVTRSCSSPQCPW